MPIIINGTTVQKVILGTTELQVVKVGGTIVFEASKPCTACGGTGKITCTDCDGSGDCYLCDGTGTCYYCDGDGKCRECGGSGEIDNVVGCVSCDANGYWYGTTCWECEGGGCSICNWTGNVRCSVCGGSGTEIKGTTDCYDCGGSGKCTHCNGYGECHICDGWGDCDECGGDGKKSCGTCGGDGKL